MFTIHKIISESGTPQDQQPPPLGMNEYLSPRFHDGYQVSFVYPSIWGDVSVTEFSEMDEYPMIPRPRYLQLTFTNLPSLDACPGTVEVNVVPLQNIQDRRFQEYQTPVLALRALLAQRENPTQMPEELPHLPYPVKYSWPANVIRLTTDDGQPVGLRYIANVAQDVAPDISYQAFLETASGRALLDVFADLDCGTIQPLRDTFFNPVLEDTRLPEFAAAMQAAIKQAPTHARLGPTIHTLDAFVKSIILKDHRGAL